MKYHAVQILCYFFLFMLIYSMMKNNYVAGYYAGASAFSKRLVNIKSKCNNDGNVIKYPFKKEQQDGTDITTPPKAG